MTMPTNSETAQVSDEEILETIARFMGLNVLGVACGLATSDDWLFSDYDQSLVDNCTHSKVLVYLKECVCDARKSRFGGAFGHESYCLAEVPSYLRCRTAITEVEKEFERRGILRDYICAFGFEYTTDSIELWRQFRMVDPRDCAKAAYATIKGV